MISTVIFSLIVSTGISVAAPPAVKKPLPVPTVQPVQSPSPIPQTSDTNQRLKNAMIDAQKNLGQMESWQKKIFDEEVVPQFQRFIKDYRQNTNSESFNVEIDYESLRHYLRFYGPTVMAQLWGKGSLPVAPQASSTAPGTVPGTVYGTIPGSPTPVPTIAPKELKVLVYLKTDTACEKCLSSETNLKNLVKARIETRGMTPVWLTSEELGASSRLMGRLLDEKIVELARLRNFAGAVVLVWQPVPPDDIESAHADENHYFIHNFIQVRDLAKHEGRIELMDTDSFENAATRLWTDSLTELGLRSASARSETQMAQQEVQLEITGFRDFAQYSKIKAVLQGQMKGIASLEERVIARSRVVLGIGSSLSKDEIQKQISLIAPETLGAGVKLGIK